MCGIAGLLTGRGIDRSLLQRMATTLEHRGPDDQGIWLDDQAGVGLGHRRLSIVDLSPSGHQPMASRDGRLMIAYNGEIYNHADLRAELDRSGQRQAWRGHSDTETLVECIAAWGLKSTLEKSVGMFALAVWDRRERHLLLARDRFGEKPLYYGWVGGDFAFGSELKSLRCHPNFQNGLDRGALHLFAARGYIPAPHSIYENIFKLEPASILTVPAEAWRTPLCSAPTASTPAASIKIEPYWSYRKVVSDGLARPLDNEHEALDLLEKALSTAIGGQSVADVPVGAFLSGGIDSSTVVGLYQKYSPTTVRTFSIGFEDATFNEAGYAKQVARHFGTDHNERYVTVKEAQDVIPLLPAMYDEPFADSSQIPTYLVSKFAREQVTVALSGDGGDELFAGYNRHFQASRLWATMRRLPLPLRTALGGSLGQVPAIAWDRFSRYMPGGQQRPHFGAKVQKVLRTMGGARDFDDVYNTFLDEWSFERAPVRGDGAAQSSVFNLDAALDAPEAVRMMHSDAVSYLPDDILCKVDRAAMAISLETRVPFLDHRVAEFAARIPIEMKIRNGKGKHILRQLLYREAPQSLFDRPKAGFGIPVGDWIRGALRPWAEELLDRRKLEEQGFFDAGVVLDRWRQHLDGKRDGTSAIWAVLMFQAWHAEQART